MTAHNKFYGLHIKSEYPWLSIALIVGLSVLIYLNTLQVPFQYDDSTTVISNPSIHVQHLNFSELKKVLQYNRPVSNLSFAMNYYIGKYNVISYHWVNLAIHSLTGCAVYLFLLRTLGPSSGGVALIVALLWTAHPVQTQAVTYITQRMASLAALFFMWSLVCYVMARSWNGPKRAIAYAASLLFALLAVGSKENTATLPVVLLLYEYYFLSKFSIHALVKNWRYWAPVLLTFMAMAVVYVWLFILGGSFSVEHLKEMVTRQYIDQVSTPLSRSLTELRVLIYYISLLVLPLPSRLNIYHDFSVSTSLLMPITTVLSLIAVAALIFFAVKMARNWPLVSFGIFWFLITLSIESFVFQLDLIFEHRLYLPSIGFFLILAWAFKKALVSDRMTASRNLRMGFISLGVVVLGLYSVGTVQRNTVWQDEVNLWADAVQKSPNQPRTHNGLGVAYQRKGQVELAIQEFEKTLQLDSDNLLYRVHLGQLYEYVGQLDKSMVLFEEAIRLNPTSAGAFYNLGRVYYKQDKMDLAEETLKVSIRLNPAWALPYDLLGTIYQKKGNWVQAVAVHERLLQMMGDKQFDETSFEAHPLQLPKVRPDKPLVHYQLAKGYEKLGRQDLAIIQYQEAIRGMPFMVPVRLDLARLYVEQRKFDLAQEQYKAILVEDPSVAEAYFNLGLVYELAGDLKAAAIHYQKFLDLVSVDSIYAPQRQMAEEWLGKFKLVGHEP
jgi:tetratricopeptide (TPR) repeat protein